MIKQIVAIVLIYLCTSLAWMILGGTILKRTDCSDCAMGEMVGQLWGTAQSQVAPGFFYETEQMTRVTREQDGKTITEIVPTKVRHDLLMDASKVAVDLSLEHRQKGLLWYPTYKVDFDGNYVITNPDNDKKLIYLEFFLPASEAIYDDLKIKIGNREVIKIDPVDNRITEPIEIEGHGNRTVSISYKSRGLNDWHYLFGRSVNQVRNFDLTMKTDFDDIDFPQGSISPASKKRLDRGWQLVWSYENLLTGYSIGMTMPRKLNPGPWVSEVTFFAPVSLFLFYFLLFMSTTIKGLKVHPMNYFFIGAAFFSFHLLMAYLVDHIQVEQAFLISAIVSVTLVVSYMRLVVSNRFAFVEVGIAQLIYLVLFSYTFFFEKFTGLVITILCIATLFVVMQATGRIDWSDVFEKRARKSTPAVEAGS